MESLPFVQSDFISALLAFAIVLIPAIIIHELGHFFAAKLIGVSVLEFGVGFPPRMARLFMWGETEFTLNWIPIGGFVRPYGEDMIGPSDPEEKPKNASVDYITDREELLRRGVPEDKIKSVNQAKPLQRIFFMAAGALANFATAIVLFTIIALIGLPKVVGARVQIYAGSMFANTGFVDGDAIERINGEYFNDTNAFLNTIQTATQPLTLTAKSVKTGDTYEVTITPRVNSIQGALLVTAVVADTPGHLAGVLADDVIIAANGKPLPSNQDPIAVLSGITTEYAGRPMTLTIDREGQLIELTLTPRENPPKGQGRIGVAIAAQYRTDDGTRVMLAPSVQQLIPQSLPTAFQYGVGHTGEILQTIISIPGQLISGKVSPEEARPVSIVGISRIGGEILKESFRQGTPVLIFNFIALVSIFLGFTNLLPIPALDGGRILFVLIEMVRGKPLSPEVEGKIHAIGFLILIGLGLLVIVYDIISPQVIK